MKTLSLDRLPNLSQEIKDLVSNGVYSLFFINHGYNKYALVMKNKSIFYIIDENGTIVETKGSDALVDMNIEYAVTFPRNASNTSFNLAR